MVTSGLEREREWRDGAGPALAYAHDGHAWAATSSRELRIYEDDEPLSSAPTPGGLLGEPAFAIGDRTVFCGAHAYDRDAGAWAAPPDPYDALTAGLDPEAAMGFEISAGAWTPRGDALALYAEYHPPRGIGTGPGAGGPHARLVVLAQPSGSLEALVWEGGAQSAYRALVLADRLIAAGGRTIGVWERPGGRPLAVLEGLDTVARVVRLAPDGRHLAAAAASGMVVVWETGGWHPVGSWRAHPDETAGLAFHPGGRALATGGADGTVGLWALDGAPLAGSATLDGPVRGLAFRPDGRRLLAGCAGLDAAVVALAVTARL